MSKLVVTTFLSLDGVMQGPGGPDEDRSGGFEHSGWLVPHFDDLMGQAIVAWTERADALLLGRRTYEIFAAYWPHVSDDDPIAAKLEHDLVDEYRLWIFPVLLGSGKRLFAEGTRPAGLDLVDTTTSSTGVVIQT